MGDNNGFDPQIERNYYGEEEMSGNKNIKSVKGDGGMKKFFKRADFPFFLLGGFVLILLIFILVKLPEGGETSSEKSLLKGDSAKELKQALDDIRNEIVEIRYNLSGSTSSSKEDLTVFLNEIDKRFEDKLQAIEKKVDDLKEAVKENRAVLSTKKPAPSPVKDKKPLSVKKDDAPIKTESVKNIYHTVKKGDTLYSISKKYGVNVEEIKKLNNMKTNSIQPGGKLLIKSQE